MIAITDVRTLIDTRGDAAIKSREDRIATETYRGWLVEVLAAASESVLIAWRDAQFYAATLDNLRRRTGWSPDRAYFHDPMRGLNLRDPWEWKQRVLRRDVLPEASGHVVAFDSDQESIDKAWLPAGVAVFKVLEKKEPRKRSDSLRKAIESDRRLF